MPYLSTAQILASHTPANNFWKDSKWYHLSDENKAIQNEMVLKPFFEKLEELDEKKRDKIRIVQIGDSHVQAGFFQRQVRALLQERFGNAGLGFVFPYRLAKSNGIKEVKFSSSVPWEGKRNIFATDIDPVGLSGFGLTTKERNFALKLEITDADYYFNSVKIFTPSGNAMYNLAKAKEKINFENYSIQKKIHPIKSGEALSIIARKYGVSVQQIKNANGLKSNVIRAGAKLIIPVQTKVAAPVQASSFEILPSNFSPEFVDYHSPEQMEDLWLLPNDVPGSYALNGLVLEKDHSGIVYSGIGVNGARFADYNKTPLFFDQLKALQADLIVVSLGTNESFDELEDDQFKERMETFIKEIRKRQPDAAIMVTTPPPSLKKRTYPNNYAKTYADLIKDAAQENQFAVWNLFEVLGGENQVKNNFNKGLVAKDYIHYTEKGYEYSADLFTQALMNAYYVFHQYK